MSKLKENRAAQVADGAQMTSADLTRDHRVRSHARVCERELGFMARPSVASCHDVWTHFQPNHENFRAAIRRVDGPDRRGVLASASLLRQVLVFPGTQAHQPDAQSGAEQPRTIDFLSLAPQHAASPPGGSPETPPDGKQISLPDIQVPGMGSIEQTDSIAGTLAYNPSVTQSGPPPASPFGATLPYTHALSGITVVPSPGSFTVTATVDNPITFQVTGGADIDISSDADPDITRDNYSKVVSDLTPNMSDLNGRPPRTRFWAEDLCIRHERFHANEDVMYGRAGVAQAHTWLNSQTAASLADVQTLLGQVPGRVANTVSTAMAYPGRERRAYGDGAPLYLARANAVKSRGNAGGYGKGGLSRGAKAGIGILGGAAVGAGAGAVIGGGFGAAVGAGAGAIAGLVGGLLI